MTSDLNGPGIIMQCSTIAAIHLLYNQLVIMFSPNPVMQYLLAAMILSTAVALTSAIHTPSALVGTGRSAATCGDPDDTLVFYRIHSASAFSYSYGTDLSWLSTAIRNNGYLLDGVVGRVFLTQEESTVPCYVLINIPLADTLLTTNATERDAAVAAGVHPRADVPNLHLSDRDLWKHSHVSPVQLARNELLLHYLGIGEAQRHFERWVY
ncbi:hypothetical protein MSAN_01593100 [Mycena sanguinolenta]|uniref:DUF5648 domain-containing protein n=1 Tax=Mycena sanguinolenta TaxID=230812 RepID=A0A8H6Y444_9AGAR|nr:hypothetical protein MSAN_01593100 [Mycena sanguinolenta]